MSPRETVEGFYENYLAFPANVMARRAYRDHPKLAPYLQAEWIEQVDEILEGFEFGGYDPFLCAQDIPHRLSILDISQKNTTARARLQAEFASGSTAPAFEIQLEQANGTWLISNIVCTMDALAEPTPFHDAAPVSPTPSPGWTSFYLEQLDLAFSHPSAWVPYYTPVQDPIGKDPILAYLIFHGPEQLEPLAWVLIEGGLDGFQLVFPEPVHSELTRKYGNTVQLEEQSWGETYYLMLEPPGGTPLAALRVIHREGPIPEEREGQIEVMLREFRYPDETP
ncbi:MAG: DUF3828 domain-containing protein [Anaerolineales bacterium]